MRTSYAICTARSTPQQKPYASASFTVTSPCGNRDQFMLLFSWMAGLGIGVDQLKPGNSGPQQRQTTKAAALWHHQTYQNCGASAAALACFQVNSCSRICATSPVVE